MGTLQGPRGHEIGLDGLRCIEMKVLKPNNDVKPFIHGVALRFDDDHPLRIHSHYLRRRLSSGEGIMTLAVTLCVSAELRIACNLLNV